MEARPEQIYVLQSAVHYVRKSPKIKAKHTESTIKRAVNFLSQCQVIPMTADQETTDRLAAITGVDSGEALLFTSLINGIAERMITGDKRAIHAIVETLKLDDPVVASLRGRVLTFETLLLGLFDRFGFEEIAVKIRHGSFANDKTLQLAFGSSGNNDEMQVREGLESFGANLI